MRSSLVLLGLLLLAGGSLGLIAAEAPDAGATTPVAGKRPVPKKPAANKAAKPVVPAKELFAAAQTPAPMAARSIGFYARGCLAGATALPVDGPAWQAMRLSRNRNWGHPELVALLEKFATEARDHDGWPGLLVGDMSQPRGGPMLSGHASHQVGLDADIWLTPMPDHRLSDQEREELSATSMLAADKTSVDPKIWNDAHVRLIKRAASYAAVERVLVHPAIKKALCEAAANDKDRSWLHKVRPIWGHYYHFHVRIACPKGSTSCETQPNPPNEDGCGKELTDWLALIKRPPGPPGKPAPAKPPLTLEQLPAACKAVLASSPSTPAPEAKAPVSTADKPTGNQTK
ncbi:MAG TPA: penicillin-insensitive murein endopeptidase [Hyphomicrobiaceae bacterium]|nr:penicillin-insensitive murein endopeptidase [Hyphomicrobiaceae bacterium]